MVGPQYKELLETILVSHDDQQKRRREHTPYQSVDACGSLRYVCHIDNEKCHPVYGVPKQMACIDDIRNHGTELKR